MNDPKELKYGPEFESALTALFKSLPVGVVVNSAHILPRISPVDTETGTVHVLMFANSAADLERATNVIQHGLAATMLKSI
ncbi:MAG: hypothetical protein Q7K26_01345 [bacterium]|nr:hypothetical protein [bacterium]